MLLKLVALMNFILILSWWISIQEREFLLGSLLSKKEMEKKKQNKTKKALACI